MKRKTGVPRLFSPWVIVFAFLAAIGGIALGIFVLNWARPERTPVGVVTAALTVIPAPTATQTPSPTPVPPTPNPEAPPAPPEGTLKIGAMVKISGTEGAGLRLRSQPGLDYQPLFLGMEDEVFEIQDGPQETDDYVWWYLVAPFEPNRKGWAVSNYLQIIQEP